FLSPSYTLLFALHYLFPAPYCFFSDPATPEISTLSLHDALPIWITAAGSDASTTRARPTSLVREGRHTECAKIAMASSPAKYFDMSAAPSARPHSTKSIFAPVRCART